MQLKDILSSDKLYLKYRAIGCKWVGNYLFIFWSMTSKPECSSESPILFLYLFNLHSNRTPRYHIIQVNGREI